MHDVIPPPRQTYRHGDLRRALLEAGIQLARAGGPDAVTLREATRRAGVVPNAAYRHFSSREDLLSAVRSAALSAAAVSMETELSAMPPDRDAKTSLRAIGTGYLRFARAEPGLFRTAFATPAAVASAREQTPPSYPAAQPPPLQTTRNPGETRNEINTGNDTNTSNDTDTGNDARHADEGRHPRLPTATNGAPSPEKAAPGNPGPFQLLGAALDQMVEAGILPPHRRPGAEYLAWSAVHGLAMLVLDGPMHAKDAEQIDALIPRLLDMVENGL